VAGKVWPGRWRVTFQAALALLHVGGKDCMINGPAGEAGRGRVVTQMVLGGTNSQSKAERPPVEGHRDRRRASAVSFPGRDELGRTLRRNRPLRAWRKKSPDILGPHGRPADCHMLYGRRVAEKNSGQQGPAPSSSSRQPETIGCPYFAAAQTVCTRVAGGDNEPALPPRRQAADLVERRFLQAGTAVRSRC